MVLTTSVALLPPAAHADITPLPNLPYGGAEMAQAKQTNTPVVVNSLTTDSSQVAAQPDGTFALTATAVPVRAQTSTGWQAIDTTLQTNSDGTFSPKVTETPVAFSDGGSNLLVSLGTAQQGINTYWPTALPTPTVSGSTVTYPSVRPGVNLVMTAESSGFSETLVVSTPTAAQALANNPIALNAQGNGVTISQQADGSIVATDSSGNIVFGGPPPAAWDSTVNNDAPSITSNALQSANALVGTLGNILHTVTGGASLNVTVPSSLLNNPSVHYPIYVDPDIGSEPMATWATAQSGGWDYGSANSHEPMRVGYCGWTGCTSIEHNARSFMAFNTKAIDSGSGVPTAHVFKAQVHAYQIWSATSSAHYVNLDQAGSFSAAGPTYPGPDGAYLDQYASSCGSTGSNGCYIGFGNQAVYDYLQAAANNDWGTTSFALSAPAENTPDYWKKFDTQTYPATLTVYYDFPPSTPFDLSFPGSVACTGKPIYENTLTPTVEAKATSYDGEEVGLTYEIRNPANGALLKDNSSSPSVAQSKTSFAPWTSPALPTNLNNSSDPTQPDQERFEVHAQAQDESPNTTHETSAWGGYANFTYDNTPPNQPTINSFTYPQNYWGITQADPVSPGSFTFTSPSDTSATGFVFDIGTAGGEPAPVCGNAQTFANNKGEVAATGGTATFTPPANFFTPGYHTIYVRAVDDAHNESPETSYSFYVAPPNTATTSNLVEAENLTMAPPPSTNGGTDTISTLTGAYSGTKATQIAAGQTGNQYTFNLSPTESGYYAVGVQLLTGAKNANLTFTINTNQPATQDITTNNGTTSVPINVDTGAQPGTSPAVCSPASAHSTIFVALGGFRLTAGSNADTLTVTVNSSATCGASALTAGIDDIILAPLNNGDNTSFIASFNNRGIGSDPGVSPVVQGNFDGSANDNALSANALKAADPTFVPGGTGSYTLQNPNGPGSITFPLTYGTTGPDNVIAEGQTLTMTDASGTPSPIPALTGTTYGAPGFVDFLVGSTCGPVTKTQAKEFTLLYSDGNHNSPGVPNIPDWRDNTNPTLDNQDLSSEYGVVAAAISPASYLTGSPATTSGTSVHLYVVQVPWYAPEAADRPGGPGSLASIELPRIGTDLTGSCDPTNNALHIFAMTTSTVNLGLN